MASYTWEDIRARAYCACSRCGWGSFDIFTHICLFSPLSLPFWETAGNRVKYCLTGLFNPKQPTSRSSRSSEMSTVKAGAQSSLQVKCIPCHLYIGCQFKIFVSDRLELTTFHIEFNIIKTIRPLRPLNLSCFLIQAFYDEIF